MLPWTQLNFEPKCLEFGILSGPCCLEFSWFVNPSMLGLTYCQTHITLGSANCRTQVYWVLHVARAISSWVFSSNKNINKKYWLITIKAFLLIVSSSCCDASIHIQFVWTISFLTVSHIIKNSWIFFGKNCIKKRIQLSCIIIQYQFKVCNLKCVWWILFSDSLISSN
jgi:hypothetical protein